MNRKKYLYLVEQKEILNAKEPFKNNKSSEWVEAQTETVKYLKEDIAKSLILITNSD